VGIVSRLLPRGGVLMLFLVLVFILRHATSKYSAHDSPATISTLSAAGGFSNYNIVMAKISDLPDHLLLDILQYVPSFQVLPLATMSKSLRRCSINRIYHSVYPWESPARNNESKYARRPDIPNWSSPYLHLINAGSGPPPFDDTRIYNLLLFLRTISESESLRHHIARASFNCQAHQEELSIQVIELLAPTLQNLHVKRTLASYNPNANFLPFISSLDLTIDERVDIDWHTNDLKITENREKVRSLFDLPRLKLLSLSGVRSWSLLIQDSGVERTRTSDITSLLLGETIPADQGLADVLSWPKNLKSLRYELALSGIHRHFWGPLKFIHGLVYLSAKAFGVALASQQKYLEELIVYGDTDGDCSEYCETELIDLHSFVNLQYVGLPITFLRISEEEAKWRGIKTYIPSISEILPLAIRDLEIEIPEDHPWTAYFSGELESKEDFSPGDLSVFISEIVMSKHSRFTGLRSIVIWRCDFHRTRILRLDTEDRFREVLETCMVAKVNISMIESRDPPLFSSHP
jgi:hypothetical protein